MPKTVEDYRYLAAQIQHRLITNEVFHETDAQLTKWGVQDHPMGTGEDRRLLRHTDPNLDLRIGRELEHIFRNKTDKVFKQEAPFYTEQGTYWDVLLEEVFEAGAESDPVKMEEELVQVAAVAVSMIAASRRARGA